MTRCLKYEVPHPQQKKNVLGINQIKWNLRTSEYTESIWTEYDTYPSGVGRYENGPTASRQVLKQCTQYQKEKRQLDKTGEPIKIA